jgi:type VI secretion system secreted protein Hcp
MARDCFIQIKDIDGESTDKNHPKWIEIENFNWGVEQPTVGERSSAGAGTTGRVQHEPFTFTCRLDAAFSRLVQASCKGKHIDKATVELMRSTGEGNSSLYMQFVLENLLVSKVHAETPEDRSGLPLVTVELTYGKITWTYTEMDHKTGKSGGKITASHDLVMNTVA